MDIDPDILEYLEDLIEMDETDHCWTDYHQNQIDRAREWLYQFYKKEENNG